MLCYVMLGTKVCDLLALGRAHVCASLAPCTLHLAPTVREHSSTLTTLACARRHPGGNALPIVDKPTRATSTGIGASLHRTAGMPPHRTGNDCTSRPFHNRAQPTTRERRQPGMQTPLPSNSWLKARTQTDRVVKVRLGKAYPSCRLS